MKQQQPFKGLGFLLLLAIMLLFASRLPQKSGIITNQELMQAIDNGTITSATVRQNDPPPTGRIEMVMTDNSLKQANVSNVIEIQDLLDRNGISAAVATSTEKENALYTLKLCGIADRMAQMVFGDMVEHAKPEPDIFLKAAELLKLPTKGCLVLEDSPNGVKAAYSAGMKVIMVPDLVQPGPEIRRLLFGCAESLSEVAQLLDLE